MLLFLLFEAVAVTLWLTKDNFFYLLNFSYIGACLGLGTALFTAGKRYARHFVQLAPDGIGFGRRGALVAGSPAQIDGHRR